MELKILPGRVGVEKCQQEPKGRKFSREPTRGVPGPARALRPGTRQAGPCQALPGRPSTPPWGQAPGCRVLFQRLGEDSPLFVCCPLFAGCGLGDGRPGLQEQRAGFRGTQSPGHSFDKHVLGFGGQAVGEEKETQRGL